MRVRLNPVGGWVGGGSSSFEDKDSSLSARSKFAIARSRIKLGLGLGLGLIVCIHGGSQAHNTRPTHPCRLDTQL